MRFFRTVSAILIFLLLLPACAPIQKEGIANYDKATCSVGLTANLFPSDDFLNRFPYQDSVYHYWDAEDLVWGYAKVFASLSYDAEIYEAAKTYCLENFNLSEGHTYAYNECHFAEHICYKSKNASGNWVLESQFPRHFNMFGYHDESHTLFFLGYYNSDPESEERILAQDDFSTFLKEVYSEYYDFTG